ncbi:hypothetical protein [Methyloterricola oryzae]|uniref:hypothetical protein n=1 Tax=Methyloterricola oryzae TaxID=1495050 RepID=UPI002E0DC288
MGQGSGSDEGRYINWLSIKNQADRVLEDVKRTLGHVLVGEEHPHIYGFVYDINSGTPIEVPEAMAAGRAV